MPKVDVSFKKTSRDMKLYLAVTSQEEKSDFVKNAIEHYLRYLEKEKERKIDETLRR